MNKKINMLLVIILLLTTVQIAVAVDYPQLKGYVTDNANIIDQEYEQKITELAEKINKETAVEIAVLTVESLQGDSPENYALNTFRGNGVGKKDKNNGLLILVAKQEREYRFEVGYGLEGTIPDSMKVPIGERIIVPNFKNGEYGKGIYESIVVIDALITNNTEVISKYGLSPQSGSSDIPTWVVVIFVFIIIIFIVAVILGGGGSGGGGGGYSSGGYGGGWGGGSSGGGGGSSGGGWGGGSSGGGGFGGRW